MKFQSVIGQEKAKAALINAVNNGIIAHAQMFTGPEGCGSYAMALAYAQYLNCTNRNEKDSCGECDSCKRIMQLQHPDLHFSFPIVIAPKKENADAYLEEWRRMIHRKRAYFDHQDWVEEIQAESKNLIINVSEAQSLSSKLWLKAFSGKYKIMILFEPESMHESAANKLLKIIEEPPEKSVILLVSEKPENVLMTIRSRTQLLRLNPLGDEEIASALRSEFNLDENNAAEFARLSNGNFGRAMGMAQKGNIQEWFVRFRDWMRLCYTADMMKLLPWVDDISGFGREEQRNFLSYSLELIRQCLSGNYSSGELLRLSQDELGFANKFGPFINHTNALEFLSEFQTAQRDLRGNINAKLVFFDLSVRLHKLLRKANSSE